MKRVFALLVCLLLAVCLAACGAGPSTSGAVAGSDGGTVQAPNNTAEGAEVTLLMGEDLRGGAYGQAVANTISRFCGEEGLAFGTYALAAQDSEAALATLELAARGEARLIVGVGDEAAQAVQQAAAQHPHIRFVLFEAQPGAAYPANVTLVEMEPAGAGWLAGYTAVLDGARALAFVHTEQADAALYNAGFALGAQQAAAELELPAGEVRLTAALMPEEAEARERALHTLLARSELLFVQDAALLPAALRAARSEGAQVVGLGTEKSGETVWAAVQPQPADAVYAVLGAWQAGTLEDRMSFSLDSGAWTLAGYNLQRTTDAEVQALLEDVSPAFCGALREAAQGLLEGEELPARQYAAWRAELAGVAVETMEFGEDGVLRTGASSQRSTSRAAGSEAQAPL